MQIKQFKRPTYEEVRDYMFLFIFKHKESYPELMKLDVSTLAHEFINYYKRNNWEYFGIEKKLEKWECAARRLIIRQFPYIPLKVAFVGVLSYEEKEEENIRRREQGTSSYFEKRYNKALENSIKKICNDFRLTYAEKLVFVLLKLGQEKLNRRYTTEELSILLNIEHDIVKAGIKKLEEHKIVITSK